MRVVWDAVKTSLTDYFDGTGTNDYRTYEEHSKFKLKHVLFYNNQDNDPDNAKIQRHRPIVYISFDSPPEWLPLLGNHIQRTTVDFTIKFEYQSFKEKMDNYNDFYDFSTAIVNFFHHNVRYKDENFVMSAPVRVTDVQRQTDGNLYMFETSFRVNIVDKSIYKNKYVVVEDFVFDEIAIFRGCGPEITHIDGGTAGSVGEDLSGKIDGVCIDVDGIDGGGANPSEDDITIDGGDSTKY